MASNKAVVKAYWSEPFQQHTHIADNRIGTLKANTNSVMARSRKFANLRLLALIYVPILL